jgi:hypothetical protein
MPSDPILTSYLLIRNRVKYAREAALAIKGARDRARVLLPMRVVIVDHASNSEAASEALRLAEECGFEHRRYEEPLRLFPHWNRVIQSSETEWIHVHHDDDMIEPDFFTEFHQMVSEFPEASMFTCPFVIMDMNSRMTGGTLWNFDRGIVKAPQQYLRTRCQFACSAFVFKRSLYDALNGYDEALDYSGDWKFYWEAFKVGKMAATDRPLMRYRSHEGSITEISGGSFQSVMEDVAVIKQFASEEGVAPEFDSALGKIWAGCKSAATTKDLSAWFRMVRLAVPLRPRIRDLVRILYTFRLFFESRRALPSGS